MKKALGILLTVLLFLLCQAVRAQQMEERYSVADTFPRPIPIGHMPQARLRSTGKEGFVSSSFHSVCAVRTLFVHVSPGRTSRGKITQNRISRRAADAFDQTQGIQGDPPLTVTEAAEQEAALEGEITRRIVPTKKAGNGRLVGDFGKAEKSIGPYLLIIFGIHQTT